MNPLPDDIQWFLAHYIESIEQLDILRILGEDPTQEWSTSSLAAEIQSPSDLAATHLASLRAKGLIASIARQEKTNWQYGPVTPELEQQVARLLECYLHRPVTMIKLVYARPPKSLEALADAFRFRKDV